MLVLGSAFLMQEVGWVVLRWRGRRELEERSVVMADGAVKGAGVEADVDGVNVDNVVDALGLGGRAVMGVVVMSLWMVLMTAIYFHTWFEKVSPSAVFARCCRDDC
jgi:ATP adenylyltransferase